MRRTKIVCTIGPASLERRAARPSGRGRHGRGPPELLARHPRRARRGHPPHPRGRGALGPAHRHPARPAGAEDPPGHLRRGRRRPRRPRAGPAVRALRAGPCVGTAERASVAHPEVPARGEARRRDLDGRRHDPAPGGGDDAGRGALPRGRRRPHQRSQGHVAAPRAAAGLLPHRQGPRGPALRHPAGRRLRGRLVRALGGRHRRGPQVPRTSRAPTCRSWPSSSARRSSPTCPAS